MKGEWLYGVLELWLLFAVATEAAQMLKDPGFENHSPSTVWQCPGCKMDITADHIEGQHSVKIFSRQAIWAGPQQSLYLKSNTRYYFQARVKQLNNLPGKLFQSYGVLLDTEKNSGSHDYNEIIRNKFVYNKSGWITLAGYFMYHNSDYKSVTIRVDGPDPGIDFLMDDTSLMEIPEDKNWKEEADKRIEQLRKSNIHFSVNVPSHVSTADLEIQVDLVKHGFPFGSQTAYEVMSQHQMYEKLFFYLFNWATLSSFYWEWSHPPRHNPDYSDAMKEVNILHQHGVPVRAHNIFWGADPKYTPDWVQALSPDQVKQSVDERIQYIVRDTKGRVEHWDVNNELLHGQWFEEKTGDPDYTKKIFAKLQKADPQAKLFLNDHSVVSSAEATSAYVDQAKSFKAANVGLYGLGVQCHFPENEPPDPTLIKKRLDQLATVGLPLWATEMDFVHHDENTRAEWYDIGLHLLFSHPAVEGIILWGFWSGDHWRGPDAAIVSGADFHALNIDFFAYSATCKLNAAGKRYVDLLQKGWSSHFKHKVSTGKQFDVRGFHGDYLVTVKYHGNDILHQSFSLGKQDKHIDITIPSTFHTLNSHTTWSPGHVPNVHHPVSHINENTIGYMTSSSSNQLTCIVRYSGFSQVGDDKMAAVSCPSGYVLTGCSGKIKDNYDTRDGERIDVQGGVAQCQAYDSSGTTAPVQAVARCCKLTGLKCDYRKSGPSQSVLNQRLETRCLNNMYATGCSSHSYFKFQDGTFPTTHSCVAQNQDNNGKVESFAACCSAPRMTCEVKVSKTAGDKVGDQTAVSCDHGWELLGCSAYSEDSKLGGAKIEGSPEQCIAVNGAQRLYQEMGATAYATCCRTH